MKELAKAYDASITDKKWLDFWNQKEFFKANPDSDKPPYCLTIPPPNVTGVLHMGHALVNTLQDILIRWKKMCGYEVLWVPGTDHAGISTQTVVERQLMKSHGKRRKDFSREEFLSHVWAWKEACQETIIGQLKRLGCSLDWSRLRFTMDEGNNKAVRTTFKRLYDDGLIYQGDYLVNWDPVTQTALADDEVEYEERQSFLWTFKYPLVDGSGFVRVSTTRPETMLGDTAIAVSPKDPRFQSMIGKLVRQPLSEKEIPIIADPYVDEAFGTGMVKITPAHDPNDYLIGINHKLPFINIMTPDGKLNENGKEFAGMTMQEGRAAVVEKMQQLGFLESITPHVNRVGISYRSKAVIEPYMSKQWFVNTQPFKETLIKLVQEGDVKLIPGNWEPTYFYWIDNLRDWCISRQLWWGHRIPIWTNKENRSEKICYDGEGVPDAVKANPDLWEQDEDVLDTWFSSALWPFATLGWPDETKEFKKFYPISVLVTGHDILFFWVARMMMMGTYLTKKPPFAETFLHGLIYGKSYWRQTKDGAQYVSPEDMQAYEKGAPVPKDVQSKWEKMSKSKGNIIDPLEMIDTFGTDATRMALTASATQAREIDLDRRKFEEFKNFANKVWNGARFVLMNLSLSSDELASPLGQLDVEDQWILHVLNETVTKVNTSLENYHFDHAANTAYDFFWKDFCGNYLEIVKPYLFDKWGTAEQKKQKQQILVIVLLQALRLMHPITPFITEELFSSLKEHFNDLKTNEYADPLLQDCINTLTSEAIAVASYPKPTDFRAPEALQKFQLLEQLIYAIRNLRGEMKLPPGMAIDIFLIGNNSDLSSFEPMLRALTKVGQFSSSTSEPNVGVSSTALVEGIKILIPLPAELQAKEKERLIKEQERLQGQIERLQTQLNNAEFVSSAPPAIVEKNRALLAMSQKELLLLLEKLNTI